MDAKSDADLVASAKAGDKEAYGLLIQRFQRSAYGLACVLLGDQCEAEDITQEAFLRAWQNLDLLSDPAKFAPWLRRIVFGVSIDWLRTFRPDLYRLADSDIELVLFSQPAATTTALAALETIELRQRVWDAVARLPPNYRLPLTLFHLDGLSHAKVADAIGVGESTVRSLVTRARKKLAPMLATYAAEVLPALQDILAESEKGKSMLHIVDGESVAGTLRESIVPGEVRIYGDLMYEGRVEKEVGAFEDTLLTISRNDETVLWMDHRLSDQLILIKVLEWIGRRSPGRSRLSLICVGRFPGMDRFIGLGQLTADQLTSLADTRLQVTDGQLRLATEAWNALTSADPTTMERVIDGDTSALPFLGAALRRYLEQFPSIENGLSRTEQQALLVLRERGSLSWKRLFFAVQAMEDPHFMGDLSFLGILKELAGGRSPLVHFENELSPVSITEVGLGVLDGRDDHIRLNGIDRWLGGVHLTGSNPPWRWDRQSGRLYTVS
jgi:RNA polymerase sigma factor (sigma-70 family)